jgi:hypothetical protein
MLLNSLVMALIIAVGKIAISLHLGLCRRVLPLPAPHGCFWMIFITLMLPVEVRIIPTYKVVADLGMLDSFAGLTLPLIAADGEFVVLVGPSGCGKSTTLRMIAGLEDITGRDLDRRRASSTTSPPKDRDIAMVFQNYALYPHMTVFDNMAFGLRCAKFPKAEIDQRGRRAAAHPRHRAAARPQAAPALRRPAPARRHGPRHRARTEGVPVRRAAVQPRRQAARADAHRDQEGAPAVRHHHDLRHPRPGRGDDHGRPRSW